MLIVALRVVRPIQDPDTYWHLAAGDLLRATGDFHPDDPWGTATSRPWIFNQWMPELLMSWTHGLAGLAGVAWLLSLAAVALALALWVASRRRASILVAAVVMSLAFVAQMGSLTPRPQVISFILTVVFADVWLRTADDGRPRWWLVPLSWVWACSHGMWFLAVLIGAVIIIGLVVERGHDWPTLRRLSVIPLLSATAAALTPAGPGLVLSPLQVHGVTRFIAEWQPPAPTDAPFIAFLLLLAIPVMGTLSTPRSLAWHVILLLAMAVGLALLYTRTVPIAAAMITPLAASSAKHWLPREAVRRPELMLTAALAVIGLLASALLASSTARQPGAGLLNMDRFIGSLAPGTILCNEWTDGGWLIWRHPAVKVTMDGRAELYSVEHIESYARFVAAEPGWRSYLARVGCHYALLPTTMPVVEALINQERWEEMARADGRVLLRAPDRSGAGHPQ